MMAKLIHGPWTHRLAAAMPILLLAAAADAREARLERQSISTLMSCVTMSDFGVVDGLGAMHYREGYVRVMRSIYRHSDLTENDLRAAVDRGVDFAARLTEDLASIDTDQRQQAEVEAARMVAECNIVALDNR